MRSRDGSRGDGLSWSQAQTERALARLKKIRRAGSTGDGSARDGAVPLPLSGILAVPAIRTAVCDLARAPASAVADSGLREALDRSGVPESPLRRALIEGHPLRSAFTAAVRGGIDSSAAREFLVRYLSATGRTAELERLNSESHLPEHRSDLFDLFAKRELRALDELHEQLAAGTVEPSLRDPTSTPGTRHPPPGN